MRKRRAKDLRLQSSATILVYNLRLNIVYGKKKTDIMVVALSVPFNSFK